MKRQDVIEKLCELVTKVGEEKFNDQIPHDCFCGASGITSEPVIDDEIIKFIEDAVNEKLSNVKSDRRCT